MRYRCAIELQCERCGTQFYKVVNVDLAVTSSGLFHELWLSILFIYYINIIYLYLLGMTNYNI